MFDLAGKKALITGASGGIGRAIAKQFHAQGAVVAISGTRKEVLQELADELGERVHVLPCNLTDREAVGNLITEADEALDGIDILVCNAGVTRDNLALRMKDTDFDDIIEINLRATFILNKAALKKMVRRKWGRIINIASVVAVSGNPGQANYVASKAGMIGMSKSFAAESASRNITVNCIAPGFIATKMTDALTDDQKNHILKTIPRRKLGSPDDIAASAVFLASDEAGYMTGQTLHINGGMLMI